MDVFFVMDTNALTGISSRSELAISLGVRHKVLTYLLFALPRDQQYTTYDIKKRSGDYRTITAPIPLLKSIQKKLAALLLELYPGRACVYGFLKGKNVKMNAAAHSRKRWVVNLDLQDFFPSINFGRVKGLFRNKPFDYPDSLARDVANLCCFNGLLPQGAPTSPIISNFICWRLDNDLQKFAKKNKCIYSRYADDITFSSNIESIPESIGSINGAEINLSEELESIIHDNGFQVNSSKTRYSFSRTRQEVTGLIVNNRNVNVQRKYVMQVRAMIHSWEKYGLKAAAKEHFEKYDYKAKKPSDNEKSFIAEVIGKIGYIRFIKKYKDGEEYFDSPVYRGLADRVNALLPEAKLLYHTRAVESASKPMIFCEGKTDWMLIKKALEVFQRKGEFTDIDIDFRKYEGNETAGVTNLISFCHAETIADLNFPGICLFDRDERRLTKGLIKDGESYSYRGHNIYAMLLPVPDFRSFDEICIEQLFKDSEIQTEDDSGRRLYLSTEFDKSTGVHLLNNNLSYSQLNHLKFNYPKIIDSNVYDKNTQKNVALPKRDFAYNISNDIGDFAHFSFEGFRPLFEMLRQILSK